MKELPVKELIINPFTLISDEWLLITAGNEKNGYNTMTACWGHIGAIWGHGKGLSYIHCLYSPSTIYKRIYG